MSQYVTYNEIDAINKKWIISSLEYDKSKSGVNQEKILMAILILGVW